MRVLRFALPIKRQCIGLLGLWAGALLPSAAVGHPHEWIDLRVSMQFDAERRLIAMEQSWLFDPFFSAYVLEELTANRPNRRRLQEQADTLGPQMVTNLSAHNFLNKWTYDGKPVDHLTASFVSAHVKRKQMELILRIELPQPLDLSQGTFEYRVFDPTYYIEMLHADRHRPGLKGAPWGCRATIHEPEPSEDLLIYAAELDRNESPEDGLGQHFAERVIVTCPDQ